MTTQTDRVLEARANLLAAIGAATGGAVDEGHEEAILNAIARLEREAGDEAIVAKAEAYVRVQRLIESENGRIAAAETKLGLAVEDEEKRQADWCAVEGCQTPPEFLDLQTNEFVCRGHIDGEDGYVHGSVE